MLDFIVLALATFRLASLFANENGPGSVFLRLRRVVGVEIDDSGRYGTNVLSKLLICIWCSSVWIGVTFTVFYALWPKQMFYFGLALALSAGAILVDEVLNTLMKEA